MDRYREYESEYCCCNTSHIQGNPCPIHEKEYAETGEEIKKVSYLERVLEKTNEKSHWYELPIEIYYWFYRLWNNEITQIPRRIKWFIQRGQRGYAECDVWDFCSYLPKVVLGAVKDLREKHMGFPCNLTDEKWNEILDEIIWTFNIASSDKYEYLPTKHWSEKKYQKLLSFYEEMNTKYPTVYNTHLLTKEESRRYENGMRLFIKYMRALWD